MMEEEDEPTLEEVGMLDPHWEEPTLEEIIQEVVIKFLAKKRDNLFYLNQGFEQAAKSLDFGCVDVDILLEPFKHQLECILMAARDAVLKAKAKHSEEFEKPKDARTNDKANKRMVKTLDAFNRVTKIDSEKFFLPKAPQYAKYKGKRHSKDVKLCGKIH